MLRLWQHRLMQCLIVIMCALAATLCILVHEGLGSDPKYGFYFGGMWTAAAIFHLQALELRRQRRIRRLVFAAGMALVMRVFMGGERRR